MSRVEYICIFTVEYTCIPTNFIYLSIKFTIYPVPGRGAGDAHSKVGKGVWRNRPGTIDLVKSVDFLNKSGIVFNTFCVKSLNKF